MYIYYTDKYYNGGQTMKKRIGCIALVLGIATIFSGCGGSSNKTDVETNKTETYSSVEASKKKAAKIKRIYYVLRDSVLLVGLILYLKVNMYVLLV